MDSVASAAATASCAASRAALARRSVSLAWSSATRETSWAEASVVSRFSFSLGIIRGRARRRQRVPCRCDPVLVGGDLRAGLGEIGTPLIQGQLERYGIDARKQVALGHILIVGDMLRQ